MLNPAAETLEEVLLYADLKGRHYSNYNNSDGVIVLIFQRCHRNQ